MAKDKTRERSLPAWLKQRTTISVSATPALLTYYGISPTKFLSWHDLYGNFRQGAKVRA